MADIQKQAMQYYELVRQGVSPQEAFRQAFPNGIPTQQDRMKEAAKSQQKQAMGSLAGLAGGALGTRAAFDLVTGKPILGLGGKEVAKQVGSKLAEAVGTKSTLAAPEIVGAEKVSALAPESAGIGSYAWPAVGALLAAEVGTQSIEGLKKIKDGKDISLREQAALALPTFGLSFAYNPIKGMFDKDMWKTEGNRLRDVGAPQGLIDSMPTKGRSKEELMQIARDTGGNVKFAESRSEGDLTPQDIVNYAAFAENDPTWFNKSMNDRLSFADQALKANAVREHHGTIDVDFSKFAQPVPKPGAIPQGTALHNGPQPIQRQLTPEEMRAHKQFGSMLVSALR